MKKIAILGPAHPYRGGIAAFSDRLASTFAGMGHEVAVFTFKMQYPPFLFPGQTQYTDAPPPANIKVVRALNSVNPFNWLRVGRQLRRLQPDLLVCKYWLPFMAPALGTVLRQVRRNKHTKIIAIAHNVLPHEKRPGDRLLTQYFVSACGGFVAMSKAVAEDLRSFGTSAPVRVIPHPVYDHFGEVESKVAARKQLGIPPDEKMLLFFGLVRPYKGLDLLIKAMADNRLRQLGAKLTIAGEYYEKPEVYGQLIAENKLSNAITQHPHFIPDGEVRHYFCAADMVVLPYKTATQSGITQMAYHFGRPMLVSDVGGLPEIVPDGVAGYVVPPEPAAIATAIYDFYANGREAEFARNVTELKQRFSWQAMAEGVLDLAQV